MELIKKLSLTCRSHVRQLCFEISKKSTCNEKLCCHACLNVYDRSCIYNLLFMIAIKFSCNLQNFSLMMKKKRLTKTMMMKMIS